MKYRYDSTKGRYLLAEFDGQVQSLPTASAALEGTVYQYVGATDSNYTNGYFYRCESDGAATPTYSWVQTDVQPQTSGDYIEKVTTMPTASADELGNEYQYMGADDSTNGLIHAHFYECVSDGESTPTYSWHDLGYKKVWGPGHKADWDALSVAEKVQYDEAHFDDDEGTGVDAYSTTETKTNKVWIDGKPIYRKVYHESEVNVSTYTVESNMTYVDTIVSMSGQIRNKADRNIIPFGYSGGSDESIRFNSNNLSISFQGFTVTEYWVILEYTKTTD